MMIHMTEDDQKAILFMLGMAMGATLKLDIPFPESQKLALDKFIAQSPDPKAYTYFHDIAEMRALVEKEKAASGDKL